MSDNDERAIKLMAEIKSANELYNQKLKALNEKKNELHALQIEAFEALQNAATLNDQFNTSVNSQLLQERNRLLDENKKLKG